jgi:hypothetical protein
MVDIVVAGYYVEEWFILLWLVILLTFTVLCLTEKWFILMWLVILLTSIDLFDRGVFQIVMAGYIVDHYCFMFDRGVVDIVVAVMLFPITVSGLTEEWFILFWLVILMTIAVLCLTKE